MDPAAADAETVRRGQHIADDQTAVLHPRAHARVREDDADGRRAVERVQVRIAEDLRVQLLELRDVCRVLQHDDLPRLLPHAAGGIAPGLQDLLQLLLFHLLRPVFLHAPARQQTTDHIIHK